MKQASAFTVIFLIFICSAVYSFSTYVQPGIPNEKDDIFIIVDGGLSGGATIIDSGVTVSENSITVSIAIEPCTDSICPALYEIVSLSFPIGKLSARTYMLNTFIYYIYDTTTSSPPDTSGENYSGSFEVFADSEPVPRLVGLYVTNHEEKDEYYTGCYYFTNGDTLSVVAVFEVHCCAQFTSDLSFSGDTLIVTLEDTSEAPCSCVGQHYVTSAIANIENDKQPVKVIFKSEWYNPEFSPFIADISKPAVCINIQDSTEAGFKLFIDSRWFEYEINSPFISSANVLRLQPNTDFVAYDSNFLTSSKYK